MAKESAEETTKEGTPQKSRIEVLEEVVKELIDKVEVLTEAVEKLGKTAVRKTTQRFGAEHIRKAVKDTKTGKVYPSLYSAGKAIAPEYEGLSQLDKAVFYKIQKADPGRLVILEEDSPEAKGAWEKADAELQRAVDEANKAQAAAEAAQSKPATEAKKKK